MAEENTAYASVDGCFYKDLKEILCYPAARTDESFTLPKETEKYDEKETFVCEKLKDIHVEEGNSKYSSYDGCIYNKEKTLLFDNSGSKRRSGTLRYFYREIRNAAKRSHSILMIRFW